MCIKTKSAGTEKRHFSYAGFYCMERFSPVRFGVKLGNFEHSRHAKKRTERLPGPKKYYLQIHLK